MNRRKLSILLPLAAATLTAGCTTFTDNDAAARVGDVELSFDELSQELTDAGASEEQSLDANNSRQVISGWISGQLTEAADPSRAAEAYPLGITKSGSACLQVTVTESEDAGNAALLDLEAGQDFASVFALTNIDPSLDQSGGSLGCLAASQLPFNTGNSFVDALLDMSEAAPLKLVDLTADPSQVAFGLIRFVPFDELGPAETPVVNDSLTAAALGVDVYVDPQFGTYDQLTGSVLALG